MTAKEFLQQVFAAYQAVDSKLEQIARIQSLATRTTTIIRSTPCGGGTMLKSRVENAILSMQGKTEALLDEIDRLFAIISEVSGLIAKVADKNECQILEYRYLCFYSWKQISHVMKMSLRYVFKLHARALENFSAQYSKGH